MKPSTAVSLTVIAFVAGAAAAYFWPRPAAEPARAPVADATSAKERKILYWHDPMVPGARFDKPGKSPFMDMDLVPVYDDAQGSVSAAGGTTPGTEEVGQRRERLARMPGAAGEAGGAPVVTVRPEIVNNLGVRTYKVVRTPLRRRATTHGYLMRHEEDRALYAQVDIFDRDADWVRVGQPARLTFDALPGETFTGSVAHVDPDIGIGARTLKAQVRITQADSRLKPNMFAEVVIESPSASTHLAVPRESLIRTGSRTAVVLALGDGRFQPTDVVAGRELGEFIEIRQGLKEGDSVVVSGQFLIDSEASLRATFTRMTPTDAPATAKPPAPDAGQHKH
jgi:multidrug efflux pump subunit AcrA (membrane-fusion protein)